MPLSFTHTLSDFPSQSFAPGKRGYSYYTDDVLMGYRGLLAKNIKPLACFGHGLSYTKFGISRVHIGSPDIDLANKTIEVEVRATVQNLGDRAGQEVVQVYLSPSAENALPRASKELSAFGKVNLQPGQQQDLVLKLDRLAFSYWEPSSTFQGGAADGAWRVDSGTYRLHVGTSLEEVLSEHEVVVQDGFSWNGL